VSDDRCKHEMLPDYCATCRGLKSVEEQAATDLAERRRRLLALPRWFPATYPGACGCGQRFPAGAALRFDNDSDTNYRAECCGEENSRG